jgi:hypothetical protein
MRNLGYSAQPKIIRKLNLGASPGQIKNSWKKGDDVRSSYSQISKVSKFTNNLMNKSSNGINDQWYQFIYNTDILNDSESEDGKSIGGRSRFSLHSKISDKSYASKLALLQKIKVRTTQDSKLKNPLERLRELVDGIDICRFIRINWFLLPIINSQSVKKRLFNFNHYQV